MNHSTLCASSVNGCFALEALRENLRRWRVEFVYSLSLKNFLIEKREDSTDEQQEGAAEGGHPG
jgi:hypothetical protein